jgi:YD repeat-containing protein
LSTIIKAPGQTDTTCQQYSYSLDGSLLKTTATDPKGYETSSWKDVWGRVVKVQPAAGPIVNYTYDNGNRLIKVEQKDRAGTNPTFATTTMSYDIAGRKTSMIDPDMGSTNLILPLSPNNPNSGAWHYTYDVYGNLFDQLFL